MKTTKFITITVFVFLSIVFVKCSIWLVSSASPGPERKSVNTTFKDSKLETGSSWDQLSNKRVCFKDVIEKSYHPGHYRENLPKWKSYTPEMINQFKQDWKDFVNKIPPYQTSGQTGIIYSSYSALIRQTITSIRMLRHFGCNLPVEVWYYGNEFNANEIATLEGIAGVSARNLQTIADDRFPIQKDNEKMFVVKGASLIYTKFDKVLYLDSDNLPMKNPEFLFTTEPFLETGALFWKDFWKTHPDNPIWQILGQSS